jgi:hypothetical protein
MNRDIVAGFGFVGIGAILIIGFISLLQMVINGALAGNFLLVIAGGLLLYLFGFVLLLFAIGAIILGLGIILDVD